MGRKSSNGERGAKLIIFLTSIALLVPHIPLVVGNSGPGEEILNSVNSWTVQTGISGDTKVWDNGIDGEGQIIGMGDNGLGYDHECFRNSTTESTNHRG